VVFNLSLSPIANTGNRQQILIKKENNENGTIIHVIELVQKLEKMVECSNSSDHLTEFSLSASHLPNELATERYHSVADLHNCIDTHCQSQTLGLLP